jgi:hypothetical protein
MQKDIWAVLTVYPCNLTETRDFFFCTYVRHYLLLPRRRRQGFGTVREPLEHSWNKTKLFRGVFQCLPGVKAIESSAFMERAMGIEPMSEPWESQLTPVRELEFSAARFASAIAAT